MKNILLSTNGADRATAYAMSNKLIPLPNGYLVTWLDSQRQNQWAMVNPGTGQIARSGALGGICVDNHCGAALVCVENHVHAIIGGHHSPFEHYRMDLSQPERWNHVATVDVKGTYPSVVTDSKRRIHMAYRTPGDRWSLAYCRFQDDRWTPSTALVVADKPGYIYWTNGLAVSHDDALHLVFGNTRVQADGALLYGAAHIVSHDAGETWCDDGSAVLPLPSPAMAVPLLVDECSDRVQSLADQQAHDQSGPRNFNYQQILLSNPVVDTKGVVHVVLHNGLTGTADLMSRSTSGHWTAEPLTATATNRDPSLRIHVQSSLSVLPDDRLRVALMVEQTEESVWGAPGTNIVLLEIRKDRKETLAMRVTPTDFGCAHWLPAQPHYGVTVPDRVPPLLYTKGVNAGGFDNNQNTVKTEVFLCDFET